MKIGIAGVGGIGSNVAFNLARAGVTDFRVFDFDKIEESNLNRQFYFHDQLGMTKVDALEINLKRINPEIKIEKQAIRLDETNLAVELSGCDILVEGFDNAASKRIFLETFANKAGLIVSASGIAGLDLQNVQVKKFANCHIVGDFKSDIKDLPVYSSKVNLVAAMMANIILKEINNF